MSDASGTPVRAAVFEKVGEPLAIRDLVLEEPRANEVQVRMVATGVCHTDAVVRDGWMPTDPELRARARGRRRRGEDRTGRHARRARRPRRAHREQLRCVPELLERTSGVLRRHLHPQLRRRPPRWVDGLLRRRGRTGAFAFFGQSSFATLTNAASRSVVKIPDDFPLEIAGPLGCGVRTGAGAVLNVLQPRPGGTFVVFGAGAVGLSALMAAVANRAGTVIAVDMVDSRLELATELGATHVINPGREDSVARIHEITGGGVQTALDTTGNDQPRVRADDRRARRRGPRRRTLVRPRPTRRA